MNGESGVGKTAFVTGETAGSILASAASHNAFAQIAFPGNSYACGATIWTTSPGRVKLVLDSDADPAALSIFALCSLYFVQDGLAYLGLTRLISIEKGPKGLFIVEIEEPASFSTAEPRTSERVPVPHDCPLVVFVVENGGLHRARVINVSLGGMLIELSKPIEGIELGSVLQVQAKWDTISLNLPALVRWNEGNSYGLFFNTVAQYGQPSSCPELVQIVQRLLESNTAKAA